MNYAGHRPARLLRNGSPGGQTGLETVDLQAALALDEFRGTHDHRQRPISPPEVVRGAQLQRARLVPPARRQVQRVARVQDHLDGAHLAAEWESVVVRSLGIEAAVVRQAGPERIGVQPRGRGRWIEEETLATDDLEEQILRDVAVQGRGRIRRAQPESRVPPRSV